MTILSARFANADETSAEIQTIEAGTVLVELSGKPDASGGWRAVFDDWGGQVMAYESPVVAQTSMQYASAQGFDIFALLDLKDMEDALSAASVEIPPKGSAVRQWVNEIRIAFATNQTSPVAPYSYQEVRAEVMTILNP